MKVLIVTSKYSPEYAGSALRAEKTYERLAKQFGVTYEVICNSVEYSSSASYLHNGIPVKRISFDWVFQLFFLNKILPQRLSAALKCYWEFCLTLPYLVLKKFDVIHVFGHSPSTTAAIYWSRWMRVPLILELVCRRESPFQFLPGLSKLKYSLVHNCFIVAISKYLGEICKHHSLGENVWVRPNPVDTRKFQPKFDEQSAARKRITKFTNSDRIIVSVAKFMPQKNQIFLLEVLRDLPERYKLIIAGPLVQSGPFMDRDRQYYNSLLNYIEKFHLATRVVVQPGFVDMKEYLQIADVYCMPAWNEALGTPMLESICSGVPVVANENESCFQEWIQQGVNGYLCHLDKRIWSSAILETEKFSNTQKKLFAKDLAQFVSTNVIDAKYYEMLSTLNAKGIET